MKLSQPDLSLQLDPGASFIEYSSLKKSCWPRIILFIAFLGATFTIILFLGKTVGMTSESPPESFNSSTSFIPFEPLQRSSGPIQAFSSCGNAQRKMVLTFDDGPTYPNTPILLDELDQLNVPATFYMSGWAQPSTNPDRCGLVQEIVSGRSVQHSAHMHSMSHLFHYSEDHTYTPSQFMAEVDLNLEWMQSCGANPNQYRPPYGQLSDEQAAMLTSRGIEVAMWNLESSDTDPGAYNDLNALFQTIISNFETKVQYPNSAVLLLHDHNYRYGLVTRLVEYFLPLGYEFITADECVSYCTEARCKGASGPSAYDYVFVP
jgi:peptidoglycan/xylan/chitin deacetylase (PgdA/CDA1 family)